MAHGKLDYSLKLADDVVEEAYATGNTVAMSKYDNNTREFL